MFDLSNLEKGDPHFQKEKVRKIQNLNTRHITHKRVCRLGAKTNSDTCDTKKVEGYAK